MSVSRRTLLAGAVAATLVHRPPEAAAAGLAETMAVYPGHAGCQRLLTTYEPYMGRAVYRYAIENISFEPTKMTASAWGKVNEAGAWQTVGLDDPRHIRLAITIPLRLAVAGNTTDITPAMAAVIRSELLATASGALDAKFLIVANHLKGGGHGDAILRLGHEADHRFYPWTILGGNADAYVAAYRRARAVFRSVSTGFLTDYNVDGDTLLPYPGFPHRLRAAYPGNAHVDIVGVNCYNRRPWPDLLRRLNAVASFAARCGKRLSVPEWGLRKEETGDDVQFIQNMHDWFVTQPNLLYQGYFWNYLNVSFDPTTINGKVYAAPNAKARYRALFG